MVDARIKRYVHGLCGNRCAFRFSDVICARPIMDMRIDPSDDKSFIVTEGDVAHIRGERAGAARHDAAYEGVNEPPNLMLMCDEHHQLIDDVDPWTYTVEVLEKMREEHIDAIAAVVDPARASRVKATYARFVTRAENALAFDTFSVWTQPIGNSVSRLDRERAHAIEDWAKDLLDTRMPSTIGTMIETSSPALEAGLTQAAEAALRLVQSMRSIAEVEGGDLVEMKAPWDRAVQPFTEEARGWWREQWHARLNSLGEALRDLEVGVNFIVDAWRDLDPDYRLGEANLRLG